MYDPGDPQFQQGRWPTWGLIVFVALIGAMILLGYYAMRADGSTRASLSLATLGAWAAAMILGWWLVRRWRAGRV